MRLHLSWWTHPVSSYHGFKCRTICESPWKRHSISNDRSELNFILFPCGMHWWNTVDLKGNKLERRKIQTVWTESGSHLYVYLDTVPISNFTRGGGWSPRKWIPLLGWHCETPTLTGTKFAKPYPYWYKIRAQIHTFTGTTGKTIPFLAQIWCSYSIVQWFLVKWQTYRQTDYRRNTMHMSPPCMVHRWAQKWLPSRSSIHVLPSMGVPPPLNFTD